MGAALTRKGMEQLGGICHYKVAAHWVDSDAVHQANYQGPGVVIGVPGVVLSHFGSLVLVDLTLGTQLGLS
jgi:hypothetical protein